MNILIVSPHPDDETLGAGGTLIKMKKKGRKIFWLNVTDVTEELGWSKDFIEHRKEQIKAVKEFYGFDGFYNLAFPATKLSQIDEGVVIGSIKKVYDEVKPEWIIIPGQYDAHSDHRVVYNCCMAAAKAFRAPYIKRITTMEIVSETDNGFQETKFYPNMFVDISNEIEDKIKAVQIYDTEIEGEPFPRSMGNIKALAQIRGASCNCLYAESFQIIKVIE